VAFSAASGATSRYIGYMAGALYIILGFFPKITGVLSLMPMPVMGAILIFVTCFMIISGIQSSMSLTTVVAVVLNQVLRLGEMPKTT
jgi:xanthine/uracil permease